MSCPRKHFVMQHDIRNGVVTCALSGKNNGEHNSWIKDVSILSAKWREMSYACTLKQLLRDSSFLSDEKVLLTEQFELVQPATGITKYEMRKR